MNDLCIFGEWACGRWNFDWGLTFDMRGGRKQAKPDCGRPLDGRVSRHCHGRLAMANAQMATSATRKLVTIVRTDHLCTGFGVVPELEFSAAAATESPCVARVSRMRRAARS